MSKTAAWKRELIRVGTGLLLLTVNMLIADCWTPGTFQSMRAVMRLSNEIVICSACLIYVHTVFFRDASYISKYKPPFTPYYVAIHVYLLGILVYFIYYVVTGLNACAVFTFICSLFAMVLDDTLELRGDFVMVNILRMMLSLGAIIVFTVFMTLHSDESLGVLSQHGYTEVFFSIILPSSTPFMFMMVRHSKFCHDIKDAVVDIALFALPFACIMALLGIYQQSELEYDIAYNSTVPFLIQHTPKEIAVAITLPFTQLLVLYYFFFCVLNHQTVDLVVSVTVAFFIKCGIRREYGEWDVLFFLLTTMLLFIRFGMILLRARYEPLHHPLPLFAEDEPLADT